ncbi:Metallo-dependent phosphatase [Hygrophoropsis aurantiaca]|uniref:Metallo-dependent phosphatase n=1 Tax=Hygrophoropsis aurantiaca TaxID=72124 RepID=A0ACB7ZUY4_9AGAM|nr:Metallo-dependent phosphatase [Hygrophoropsis aurantiaca]
MQIIAALGLMLPSKKALNFVFLSGLSSAFFCADWVDARPLASQSNFLIPEPFIAPGYKDSYPAVLDPYPNKPRITFREDGSFKLTVFSDLHFGENPSEWGPEQDANSTRLMEKLLSLENPDFVVLNGDLITGENTFRENSTRLIDKIVAPLRDAELPFASTHGNHDSHTNISHLEEIQRELLVAPTSYTRAAPDGVGGDGGPGNYWVPVYRDKNDHAPVLILWFFDSRGGRYPGDDSAHVPDWVDSSVSRWIKSETSAMNAAWGPAETRSAVAFVHIPPHAIEAVQKHLNSAKNPGLNGDKLGPGSTQATEDPATKNKDMAFWNSLTENVKNLRVVISGHDHGNEWCAREPTKRIIFCFDKHSGYGGYSYQGWGRGVRNLIFLSPDPRDSIETYIRLENGSSKYKVALNDEFQ